MAEMGRVNVAQHPQETEKQITGAAGAHLLQVGGSCRNRFATFCVIVLLDDNRPTNLSCSVSTRNRGAYNIKTVWLILEIGNITQTLGVHKSTYEMEKIFNPK